MVQPGGNELPKVAKEHATTITDQIPSQFKFINRYCQLVSILGNYNLLISNYIQVTVANSIEMLLSNLDCDGTHLHTHLPSWAPGAANWFMVNLSPLFPSINLDDSWVGGSSQVASTVIPKFMLAVCRFLVSLWNSLTHWEKLCFKHIQVS